MSALGYVSSGRSGVSGRSPGSALGYQGGSRTRSVWEQRAAMDPTGAGPSAIPSCAAPGGPASSCAGGVCGLGDGGLSRQEGSRFNNAGSARQQPTWALRDTSSDASSKVVWGSNDRRSSAPGNASRHQRGGNSSSVSYARNAGADVSGAASASRGAPRASRRRRSGEDRDGKRRGGGHGRALKVRRNGGRVSDGSVGSGAEQSDEEEVDVATLADLDAATKRIHALEKRLKRATHDLRAALSRLQTLEDDVVYMEARVRGAVEWRFALASVDVPLFGDPTGAKRACEQAQGDALGGALAVVQRSSWALVTDAIEVTTAEATGEDAAGDDVQRPEYEQIVCVNVVNPENGEVEHLYAPLFMSRGGVASFSRYCASPDEADVVDDGADYQEQGAQQREGGTHAHTSLSATASAASGERDGPAGPPPPPVMHVPGGFLFPSAPTASSVPASSQAPLLPPPAAGSDHKGAALSAAAQSSDAAPTGAEATDNEAASAQRVAELPFAS